MKIAPRCAQFGLIPQGRPFRAARHAISLDRQPFSVLNRPTPAYPGHVPLSSLERVGLTVGSAVMAFLEPRRHDMVAALGEVTCSPFFIDRLRDTMLADPTGRRILRERPRITSETLSVAKLSVLPRNSLGAAYAAWQTREGVSPDTRAAVRYIDDAECAYVMQRYRESHDFYHALTGLPVWREAELALKAFEFANTGLPMTALSLAAVATLRPAERARFAAVYLPWALRNGLRAAPLINVYWEERLTSDVDELRRELGIERPPDLREIRRREKDIRRQTAPLDVYDGTAAVVEPQAQ